MSRLIPSRAVAGKIGIRLPVRDAMEDETAFQKLERFLQFLKG